MVEGKLDSKSLYSIIDYEIDMVELISPLFHLIIDVSASKDNTKKFYEWGNKIFDVKRIYGRDTLLQDDTEDSLLALVAKYITDELYENADKLQKSGIEILYKRKTIIAKNPASDKIRACLCNWLSSFSPAKRLFSFIIEDRIKNLENQLCQFLNEVNYSKVIKIVNSTSWSSMVVPEEWLKDDVFRLDVIDNADVWINKNMSAKIGTTENSDIYDCILSDKAIGAIVNGYLIPFVNVDDQIKAEHFSEYFFLMISEVYSADKKVGEVNNENIKEFLSIAKESDFCKLLSYLCYNLYIIDDEVQIHERYKKFFDKVIALEKITNVDNLHLYVSHPSDNQKQDEHTLVGVYEKIKTGSEYNLLNWINATTDEPISTTSKKQTSQIYKSVHALRPRFSYYFISRYFEDCFASVLQSTGCQYRTNVSLFKAGIEESFIEIDAIIRKNDGTLIYVENKTNMNKYNVDETITKIENFHIYMKNNYPMLRWQYLIVSPYCNETIESAYRYFIGAEGKSVRDGVKNPILDFKIPIAKFDNVNLQCMVEPEYETLKSKIAQLLQ